jgi:hypothetical protein
MSGGAEQQEAAEMVRTLLLEVVRHNDDYHHRTPPEVLEAARRLAGPQRATPTRVILWLAPDRGDTAPELVSTIQTLLREIERHEDEYHYVTRAEVLAEARQILESVTAGAPGRTER